MLKKTTKLCVAALAIGILSACGGGGSDAPAATPVASFQWQSGYKAQLAAGSAANYTVSGTCAGTATSAASVPSAGTFEGATALVVTTTLTAALTNCTVASLALSGQNFYDSNYNLLGTVTGNAYAKFLAPIAAIPTAIKVGDTALLGTETVYTNSTKTVVAGKVDASYIVEADTSTTAFVTVILRSYNASNQLLLTQQVKSRIAADGTLTAISNDMQYSTTSTTHLLFTKV